MGSGTFDAKAYGAYTTSVAGKSVDEIYKSRDINKNLDPKGVKIRESRDSADNPNSTPIIVAIDVTGSMGMIAHVLASEGLGVLFKEILDRKPVTDPHLMFMAVGDANFDRAPLQVSQFEADNRIVEQLTQIYVEGGGGGNTFESYNLPWFFAGEHVAHDSIEKRSKRGYLFTVGDEEAPHDLTRDQVREITGDDLERHLSTAEMLAMAQRLFDVYHIVIEEGDYASKNRARVMSSWNGLLGQHVIPLSNHKALAETIVSAIEVAEGVSATDSAMRWGGSKATAIHNAVKHLPKARTPKLIGA